MSYGRSTSQKPSLMEPTENPVRLVHTTEEPGDGKYCITASELNPMKPALIDDEVDQDEYATAIVTHTSHHCMVKI